MIRAVGCAREALDRLMEIRAQCVAIPIGLPLLGRLYSLHLDISPQTKALGNQLSMIADFP